MVAVKTNFKSKS